MIKIAPSVMCMDLLALGAQIHQLDSMGVDMYHFDVMDGHYVPNHALCCDTLKAIRKVTKSTLDVHLMITNPDQYIEMYADAGADIISVHVETLNHPIRVLRKIRSLGKKACLAVNPATGIENFGYLMDYLDAVCIMTVDPGFAGQQMIPSVLGKISQLREKITQANKEIDIIVDGQVKELTAGDYVNAGANVLVLGNSGLFDHHVSEYLSLIEKYRAL